MDSGQGPTPVESAFAPCRSGEEKRHALCTGGARPERRVIRDYVLSYSTGCTEGETCMQCKSCSGLMLEWERGRFVAPRHGLGGVSTSIHHTPPSSQRPPPVPCCMPRTALDLHGWRQWALQQDSLVIRHCLSWGKRIRRETEEKHAMWNEIIGQFDLFSSYTCLIWNRHSITASCNMDRCWQTAIPGPVPRRYIKGTWTSTCLAPPISRRLILP